MAALALLGAIGFGTPARAQYVSGRFSMTAAGTYNQSLTDGQFPNAQSYAGPSLSFSPSAVLLVDTPLTTNTLTYAFTLNLPFTKDLQLTTGPLGYSNRFTYMGRYEFSELTNMSFTATINHSPLRALAVATDASETQLDAVPGGASYMLSASVQQSISHQLSPSLSLMQSNGLTFTAPNDPLAGVQARTFAIANSVNLNQSLDTDTFGLALSVMTNYFTVSESPIGPPLPARTQLAGSLAATWSRPLTQTLTMTAQLGVTQVISPATETTAGVQPFSTAVQPTGNVTLNYNLDLAVLTLNYAHQAAPNLITNTVNFTDTGTLRFNMPIGATGLTASGSGGFTHMTPIGSGSSSTDTFLADASLMWHPEAVPTLSFTLREQFQRQSAGDASNAFTRFATSLSMTWSYPNANAAQLPARMAPALGTTPYVPGAGPPSPTRLYEVPADEAPAPTSAPPAPSVAPGKKP